MTKTRTPEPLSALTNDSNHRLMQPIVPRELLNNVRDSSGNTINRIDRRAPKNGRKVLSPSEIRQRTLEREEMQSLLAKLKQLVPGIPKNRKLTKLEIIQHVIDYIFDLQMALESHPSLPAMGNVDFLSELSDLYSMEQQQSQSLNNVTSSLLSAVTVASAVAPVDQCDPIYSHSHSQSHHHHQSQQHYHPHNYQQQQGHPQPQQLAQSQQQQVTRIPGSYRQPLASIML